MKAIRTILACIRKADKQYNLINHGDKIMVGLSGGKDSMLLTYALSLYQKFSHTDFTLVPVTLDLGFPSFDKTQLEQFCERLGLKLLVHDCKEVYQILLIQQQKQNSKHLPCSICSRMKKAAINKVANEYHFNKVAFAHHSDDALETLLMNAIHGSRVATFSPYMHLEKANIDFIRPLILAHEKDIIKAVKEENIPVIPSSCPADKLTNRENIKNLLHNLYINYPEAQNNFVTMLSNYEQYDLWGEDICLQINQEGLYLKPVISKDDGIKMFDVRYRVFVKEQQIPYEDEMILKEEEQSHAYLIYLKNELIGTIRYLDTLEGYKISRFAILKEYRNHGYGRQVFNYLTDLIIEKNNPCTIYVHGQYQLLDFYLSCGYIVEGEPFYEAGIKHYKLVKKC